MHKESYALYEGRVTLEYNDRTHRYYAIEDGARRSVPSVTTIVGVLNKPSLIQWAANQAVNLFQAAVAPGASYDELYLTGVCEAARKAHSQIKQEAASLGTLVHNALQKPTVFGRPSSESTDAKDASAFSSAGNDVSHQDERVLNGIAAGQRWLRENNVQDVYTETPVYSRRHHYGGRLDRISLVRDRLCLVDWKTSNGIWPEYFLQIAAYRHAFEEQTNQKIERSYLVHLDKETAEFHAIEVGRTKSAKDFASFLACRHLYEALKDLNKRVK